VPRVPASLVVLVLAILASAVLHLADRGVAVVGTVTGGLPTPELPAVTGTDVQALTAPAVDAVLYSQPAFNTFTSPGNVRFQPLVMARRGRRQHG
jgi:hypothetical protein